MCIYLLNHFFLLIKNNIITTIYSYFLYTLHKIKNLYLYLFLYLCLLNYNFIYHIYHCLHIIILYLYFLYFNLFMLILISIYVSLLKLNRVFLMDKNIQINYYEAYEAPLYSLLSLNLNSLSLYVTLTHITNMMFLTYLIQLRLLLKLMFLLHFVHLFLIVHIFLSFVNLYFIVLLYLEIYF